MRGTIVRRFGGAIALAITVALSAASGADAANSLTIGCSPSCQVTTGTSIVFSASYSGGGQPGTVTWDFNGDGAYDQATGNPVQQSFSTPGTYTVQADSTQDKLTASQVVTVTPQADFSCSPSCTAPTGSTITFNASTDSGKPIYSWDLNGDGTFGDATDAAPSYTYKAPGSYKVGLKVTDEGSQQSTFVYHTLTIVSPPLVATGQAAVNGTSATLSGTVNPQGTAVDDCHFDYGTTTAYGSQAPCAQLPGAGTGVVSVLAAVSGLASGTTYHYDLVAGNAVAGAATGSDQTFTIAPSGGTWKTTINLLTSGTLQGGQRVTFQAAASPPAGVRIYAYHWDFNGDGRWDADTGPYAVAYHRFTTPGEHTVRVMTQGVSSTGLQSTSTGTVNIQTVEHPPNCADPTVGWLAFLTSCLMDDHGKYQVSLDDGVGLNGLEISSHTTGNHLTLDTTTRPWQLTSDAPVTFSLQDTPIGTVTLGTLDLHANPVQLPVGANAPSQHAPGLRILTFEALHSCPSSAGVPPVVCAQLPGNIPIEGSVSFYVTAGAGDQPGAVMQLTAHFHQVIDLTGQVTFVEDAGGLHTDSFSIATQSFNIGSIITVDPVSLSYERTDSDLPGLSDIYTGSIGAHLRAAGGFGLSIHLRFANGGFNEASFDITGHVPLGPVVLTDFGGTLGINPFRIGAQIGGIVGPLSIQAGFLFTDAFNGQPWSLQIGSFDPEHDPNHVAALVVKYPSVNPVLQAGGALFVDGTGYIAGQVTVQFALPNLDAATKNVNVQGYVRGWFMPAPAGEPSDHSSYQISGGVHVDAQIFIGIHGEVQGFVNNYWDHGVNTSWAAGCGHVSLDLGPFHPSAGGWIRVDLAHGDHVDAGPDFGGDGCGNITGQCAPDSVVAGHPHPACLGFAADTADARLSNGQQRFWIPAGRSTEMLWLSSATGIPQVTITGPSGSYTTPSTPASSGQRPYGSGADPSQHELEIAIDHPRAGAYTITPVAGTPAINSVRESYFLPSPHLIVHVTGNGATRKLHFKLDKFPGQKVLFEEHAANVSKLIGSSASSHGTLSWIPQPSRTRRRTIIAVFYENGQQQPPKVVGRYTAPAAPRVTRPGRVRLARRKGNVVAISWTRVKDAESYQLTISRTDGRRDLYVVGARRHSLTLAPVFPEVGLTVKLSAVGGLYNVPGKSRTATLRRAPRR